MPDPVSRFTLLYCGREPAYVSSQAAFALASERAAQGSTVSFLCLEKGQLWARRQALSFDIAHLMGSKLLCTHSFPRLGAGGLGQLRRLVRGQRPSRLVIDHLGRLVDGAHKRADCFALTQIRRAVAGHPVDVIVVHNVDSSRAVDFLEDGFVDAIAEAELPRTDRISAPWGVGGEDCSAPWGVGGEDGSVPSGVGGEAGGRNGGGADG